MAEERLPCREARCLGYAAFVCGGLLAFAVLAGLAEAYLRLSPPRDLHAYLGDQSPLTGPLAPDPDFGITYRSWDAFRTDNADRLAAFGPFPDGSDARPIWAFFGNSFVQAPGMLADHAAALVRDRRIFHLGRNEHLCLRLAQVQLLLEHGLVAERVFLVLMPVDMLMLGPQPLATMAVNARGGLIYRPGLPSGTAGWLVDHSTLALTAWVRSGRHHGNPHFRSNTLYQGIDEPLRDDLRHVFAHLAQATQSRQVPVTVILIPSCHQVLRGASYGFQDALTALLQPLGYDVLDPRDAFGRYADPESLYLPDMHLTSAGNRLLLAELLRHVGGMGTPGHAVAAGNPVNFTEARFVPFLLAVYVLWLLCGRHRRLRLGVLLGGSLIFYGSSRWPLLLLLLTYCVVDWAVGCWIARSRRPKLPLTLGVAFNLIVLGYWKYTPLLLRTLAPLWHGLGLADLPPTDHWQIPFGISFYTFTGIAYLVDVYRHGIAPETNLARFTLYKTFFPQLVAGPILRPAEFLADLQPDRLPCRPLALQEALWLLARGAFKKMVLADRIALAVDPFFVHMADPSTAGVWSLPYVWLYALQIYFDFSGYTDMARGLGLLFGFRWPDNFNLPYLAGSVQEFWQRWHITLSRFLRDYLYIPLGGSHCGRVRTHVNLMLTMLLGGLWHGAHWTFLLWGGLHGSFLILHRLWSERPLRARLQALTGPAGFAWRLACLVLTFHAVCLAWCFFRLNVLAQSMACVRQWFVFERGKLFAGGSGELSLWLLLGLYGSLAWLVRGGVRLPLPAARPSLGALARGFVWGAGVALLVLAVLLSPGGEKVPFIYFQF